MNSKFLKFVVLFSSTIITTGFALATSKNDIQYPIEKLGNCANEEECKTYCSDHQKPERVRNCLQVAREHHLMTSEKIAAAEKAMSMVGPGGCQGPYCKTYCNDQSHMRECLRFGVENHEMISEFDDDFAEEDVDEMKAVLNYIESGGQMPDGCSDKNSCMEVCQNPSNIDACMKMGAEIGVATGKMTREQANSPTFKKMMTLMMTEGGPGGCRFDECDDVDPEEWMPWMKAHGVNPMDMMSPKEKEQMMQGMMQMEKMLAGAPPEAKQCVEQVLGGTVEDVKAGRVMPDPSMRSKIEDCMMKQFKGMMGGSGMGPSMMGGGPSGGGGMMGMMPEACQKNGITSPPDCMEFCQNDPDHCGFNDGPGMVRERSNPSFEYGFEHEDGEDYDEYDEDEDIDEDGRNLSAQTVAVVAPVPAYLKTLAKQLKCNSLKECQKKAGDLIKKDLKKWLDLVDKYVDLKKAPKDFVKVINDLRKKLPKSKTKTIVEKKVEKAAEKKAATPKKITATQPSPAAKQVVPPTPPKNPCPVVDEVQWEPIPALPQPTKLCFGKKGETHLVLAPKVSPTLIPYYFKTTPPKCTANQTLAIKGDASGVECTDPASTKFAFKFDYCPEGTIIIPRPEDGDKPKNCFGFLPFISAFALWPYNAPSSSYASLPETAKGVNVRCDYTRESRALTLDGGDIKCKLKDLVKDIKDPNDTKTKFEGYKLPDRYSLEFPLPNIYSSTGTYAIFEDQGQVATMCAQSKYAMSNKTFSRLTSEICKLFTGASYSTYGGMQMPH